MAIAFFNNEDFINKDEAFVTLMNFGSLKFNQTASKWMGLHDKKCMRVGHDSPGNPDLATKIIFDPNNDEPKKGLNFKFSRVSRQNTDRTISCKRAIYQNSNLVSILEKGTVDTRRLKIKFDDKLKFYCHELTPQFCSELKHEHFYTAASVSCIYSLYQGRDLIYIGETCDLKDTIKRHQNDGKKFDCVKYSQLKNNEAIRKHWERFFILKWKEEHNGQLPKENKVVPYKVNLDQQTLVSIDNRKDVINA